MTALHQALAQKLSAEATRRLKQLLNKLGEDVDKEPPKRPVMENPQRRQLREQMGDSGEPSIPPPAGGVVRLRRAVEVLETIATAWSAAGPSPPAVRRAVEVLETIATPDARETLAKLAKGDAADPLTQEAREAVRRLARRGLAP